MYELCNICFSYLSRSLAFVALLSKDRLHFLRRISCASAHSVVVNSLTLSKFSFGSDYHICFTTSALALPNVNWSRFRIKQKQNKTRKSIPSRTGLEIVGT